MAPCIWNSNFFIDLLSNPGIRNFTNHKVGRGNWVRQSVSDSYLDVIHIRHVVYNFWQNPKAQAGSMKKRTLFVTRTKYILWTAEFLMLHHDDSDF